MGRPWGLRIRVLAAAGTITLVSAITFGLLLNALLDQQRAAGPARDVTEARNAIYAIQRLSQDLETGARGYLLTGDRSFLEPYTAARRELPRQLSTLSAVPNDANQRARTARLRRALDAYTTSLEDVIRRADASAVTAQESRRQFAAIRTTVAELDASERREQLQRRARSADLRERSIIVAGIGLAVLLTLIWLLSYGAVRGVVVPVDRLQRFARELGARRYGARLPESGPPETVELAQAFNAAAGQLATSEAELRRVGERHLAELDSVFAEAPLGLAFVDHELEYLRVNAALAEMSGVAAATLVGQRVRHPDGVAALEHVLATGEPVLNVEVAVEGRRLEVSYFPVRAGGASPVAVGVAVSDIEARRRAEDARERLQHATATLAAAVTVTDVARTAVAEARATLECDGAALLVVRGDGLELVAMDGLNDEKHGRLAQVPLAARRPSAEAARTGQPVHVRTPAEMAERFPELIDVPALVSLPLVTTGEPLGVLLIDFTRPRTLDTDERDLLAALATQCAIALARAELFERERDVSQTLQASLLPRDLPRIPGLDLAAELVAGAPGLDVGGDFYDAFAIAAGEWGIAIGDVCGKGVDAAALTALARHTVRAAAVGGAEPSHVLRALNRAVLAEGRSGQFLTGIYARLVARGEAGFDLTVACGGHPPPVLRAADGTVRALECTGTLLGVLEDPRVQDVEAVLAPGDTLLLYTDGLTEAGAPARTLTTEDVGALLRAAHAPRARETVANCISAAAAAGGGEVRDDIAVLVVQARSTTGRTAANESSTPGQ